MFSSPASSLLTVGISYRLPDLASRYVHKHFEPKRRELRLGLDGGRKGSPVLATGEEQLLRFRVFRKTILRDLSQKMIGLEATHDGDGALNQSTALLDSARTRSDAEPGTRPKLIQNALEPLPVRLATLLVVLIVTIRRISLDGLLKGKDPLLDDGHEEQAERAVSAHLEPEIEGLIDEQVILLECKRSLSLEQSPAFGIQPLHEVGEVLKETVDHIRGDLPFPTPMVQVDAVEIDFFLFHGARYCEGDCGTEIGSR